MNDRIYIFWWTIPFTTSIWKTFFFDLNWTLSKTFTNWQCNIVKPASIWEHSRTSVASGRVSHHQCCRALCLWPVSASVRPQRRSPSAPVRPQRLSPSAPVRPQRRSPSAPVRPQRRSPSAPVRPQRLSPSAPVRPQRLSPSAPVQPQRRSPSAPVRPQRRSPSAPVQPQRDPCWC